MTAFRDRCFCPFYAKCEHGDVCSRALTSDVKMAAAEWMRGTEAAIAQFADRPECFKET
jgi:hypothetical protein